MRLNAARNNIEILNFIMLNISDNLSNMMKYFGEVLGYKCYWEENKPDYAYYNSEFENKVLIIETPDIRHMLKNLDKDYGTEIHSTEILKKKIPIPDIVYKLFGNHKDFLHRPPFFLVAVLKTNFHNLYTDSGAKQIYKLKVYGEAGLKNISALNYFLYCYDRNDSHFKAIPEKTVYDIERYLKNENLKIYDSI